MRVLKILFTPVVLTAAVLLILFTIYEERRSL